MTRHNVKQQTIEWEELRWGKIGGTSSAGLLKPTDTLFIDIASQCFEEYEPSDSFSNYHTDRGNELEPMAREYISQYAKLDFEEVGWLQSDENRLLGISPDGLTADDEHACEIKCFARKKHFEVLMSNEIPLENVPQCIHYFTVNPKLKTLHFIAYREEAPKHFIKCLTLDSEVNIGTNAKPVIKTIKEAVQIAKENAKKLLERIEALEFNTF